MKIAAYLDEIHDDPLVAVGLLKQHSLSDVVLRQTWSSNVVDLSDVGHKKLITALKADKVNVACIASDLGDVHPESFKNENVDRALDICAYYGAKMLRVHPGVRTKNEDHVAAVTEWLGIVEDKCRTRGVKLLIEVFNDSAIQTPVELASVFARVKKLKLLYDPVNLLLKKPIDPFVKYWVLLKSNVAAIDVRDYKQGKGFKPVGFGDSRIFDTLRDAKTDNYREWLFVEPSLGRRHSTNTTKEGSFSNALEAVHDVLAKI